MGTNGRASQSRTIHDAPLTEYTVHDPAAPPFSPTCISAQQQKIQQPSPDRKTGPPAAPRYVAARKANAIRYCCKMTTPLTWLRTRLRRSEAAKPAMDVPASAAADADGAAPLEEEALVSALRDGDETAFTL